MALLKRLCSLAHRLEWCLQFALLLLHLPEHTLRILLLYRRLHLLDLPHFFMRLLRAAFFPLHLLLLRDSLCLHILCVLWYLFKRSVSLLLLLLLLLLVILRSILLILLS